MSGKSERLLAILVIVVTWMMIVQTGVIPVTLMRQISALGGALVIIYTIIEVTHS